MKKSLKTAWIILASGVLLSCASGNTTATQKNTHTKCTGAKDCTACTNCKYCKHCNSGGTCGKCPPNVPEAFGTSTLVNDEAAPATEDRYINKRKRNAKHKKK